jgi:hypothetical protein
MRKRVRADLPPRARVAASINWPARVARVMAAELGLMRISGRFKNIWR